MGLSSSLLPAIEIIFYLSILPLSRFTNLHITLFSFIPVTKAESTHINYIRDSFIPSLGFNLISTLYTGSSSASLKRKLII